MNTKCSTCGAPQQLNDTKTCIYCGDVLKSEALNEDLLKDFILIKYEFNQENYKNVILLADEYIKKDIYNIPCWAYKICAEFLNITYYNKDGSDSDESYFDFKILVKGLNNLLHLKITNKISQTCIENLLIETLNIIFTRIKSAEDKTHPDYYESRKRDDFHYYLNREEEKDSYIKFLKICSENFSNIFISKFIDLYIDYFKNKFSYNISFGGFYKINNYKSLSERNDIGKIWFKISDLSYLISNCTMKSEKMIEYYFDSIVKYYKNNIERNKSLNNHHDDALNSDMRLFYYNKVNHKYQIDKDELNERFEKECSDLLEISVDSSVFNDYQKIIKKQLTKSSGTTILLEEYLNNYINLKDISPNSGTTNSNKNIKLYGFITLFVVLIYYVYPKFSNSNSTVVQNNIATSDITNFKANSWYIINGTSTDTASLYSSPNFESKIDKYGLYGGSPLYIEKIKNGFGRYRYIDENGESTNYWIQMNHLSVSNKSYEYTR
jgi:hypothetical protein